LEEVDMRIAVGTDQQHPVVDQVRKTLGELGHEVIAAGEDGDNWVDVGTGVGGLVAAGDARLGVVCCWTGTGVSIAANKVAGVRAALCGDEEIAMGSRLYNHANVLALALSRTGPEEADAIVRRWIGTPTGGGENREMVEHLAAVDRRPG
jgi:ribose 5-phosphate isomerase B